MRTVDATRDLHPSLIGSLSVNAITAVGASVDTLGFSNVLAFVMASAVVGSNPGLLLLKVQESATPTGTNWTDITNGALNGSFTLSLTWATGTDPAPRMARSFERLNDANRLRYIRLLAVNNGTSGLGVRYAGGFLLGHPDDTLYVANAQTQATGNSQFSVSSSI